MPTPIRVLHVDDEPGFGDLVAEFLERKLDAAAVVTEADADDALDRIDADGERVDCVVSDYEMPGRDGIEFLEAVRDRHPDLPFVLFTGKGSEEVASEAISAGATDYLRKRSGTEQYDLLANRVRNAVDQYRSKRRADEHERVTRVVRDLNRALVYADSTDGIERQVCEIMTDAEPYLAACIAGVNPDTMRIEPRTWAGEGTDYIEELDMVIAPGSPGREAPGGRAFHDREIAVSQDIPDDPRYERWREQAAASGFRSLAVVPLEYGDDLFGLLAVFAHRPFAFDGGERDLLSDLGDDIAHALHAQEMRAELRATATRLEALFERSPDMISIHDADGRMTDPNPKLRERTGYDERELVGMNVRELDRTLDAAGEAAPWDGMATGEIRRREGEYERTDGTTFPVEIHVRRLDLGGADRFVAVSRDITARKETERKRRQIIDRIHDAVIEVDADWEIDLVNERAEAFSGRDESELLGRDFWDVFADARGTPFEEAYRRAMVDRERVSIVDHYPGVDEWFDVEVYPNEDGGLAFYFRAITEHKQRGRELERIERRYRAILEDPNILAGVLDDDGRLLEVNQTALDYVDADEDDVLGAAIWETPWWSEAYRPTVRRKVENALDGAYVTYEADLETPDGEPYSVAGMVRPVTDDEGRVTSLVISARDVTERTERERELEMYETIVETMDEVAFTVAEDRTVSFVNGSILDYVDASLDDFERRSVAALAAEDAAEDDGPARFEAAIERAFDPSVDAGPERIELALAVDGSRVVFEYQFSPLVTDGRTSAVVVVMRDVTERKRRERALERGDERFDQLASVVSHDLQTPLATARGRMELALETGDTGHVEDALAALKRADDLRTDVVDVLRTRQIVRETETVDVGRMAREVWELAHPAGAASLRAADPPRIDADPDAVRRLLENLLSNAVEHAGDGVTIEVGRLDGGFYVADDGPGIPPGDRDAVFDPGFSTKENGTGVGMTSVRDIATAHGWSVEVAESDAGGARFEFAGVDGG